MKSLMSAKFSLLFLMFIVINYFQWPLGLILLIPMYAIFIFTFNYWLVPGGIAWKNYHHANASEEFHGSFGFPILGNLPQMGSLFHRKLAAMAASLGAKRLMALSLGMKRLIISSHPDSAKEILSGNSFSDRPIKESARLLMFERAIGFAPSGSYWRHLRRLAANHMFSPRRISNLEVVRQSIANDMVGCVRKDMSSMGTVALRGILQKSSLSNVIESVFGSCLTSLQKDELSVMVKEGYDLISMFSWEDYLPLRFLDFYGVKRKCHKLAFKVKSMAGQIVEERKMGGDRGGCDFLGALLSLPKEDQISDSDMVALLWEMVFRGTDTVAILLEWIMARMVLHQDIQTKVQQEIDTHVGSQRHVQDSDLQNLPYLQAIVKEVLRMHPPGPLLSWARLAIHDVHIGKIFVPAGTTAMVNMWAITHDPTIWKDPWVFKPERFIEEDVSIMGSDLRLAPFGSGRRVCPGRALGLATVQLWLARLLHHFKWLPTKPVDLSECLRLSLEMNKPLVCRVVDRNVKPII